MKSIYITFILITFLNLSFAQNHLIIDANSKEIIPFVGVKYLNSELNFYSNEIGLFNSSKFPNDSIQLYCLGYENYLEKVSSLKDTIYLFPKIQELDEVVIYNNIFKEKHIGGNSNNISWSIGSHDQLALLVKPIKKYSNDFIKEIFIPISKKSPLSEGNNKPNFNSFFKVHIFSNNQGLPYKPLLKSPILVYCNEKSENDISINISEHNIKFSENGIFICIEMIGELDENANIISKKNQMPSFRFSSKQQKEFSSTAYYKAHFAEEWYKPKSEEIQLNKPIFLAVSFTLNTYEN